MHSSPLTDPIFLKMDTTNHIYEQLSPTEGNFDFQAFETDTFGDADGFGTDPLSAGGSPYAQHSFPVSYSMGYTNGADQYPSPAHEPGSPTGDMMAMQQQQFQHSPGQQQPAQMPQHIRSHPGSVSSVASSATAVSYSSNAAADTAAASASIKEESSPVSIVSHVSSAAAAAVAATSGNAAPATAAAAPAKAPAKRKRENRYKNAPPAVLSRRRAQNRASQRAYRERKDQRIRDLETELNNCRTENEHCKSQMSAMHTHMMALRVQMATGGDPRNPAHAAAMAGQAVITTVGGPMRSGTITANPAQQMTLAQMDHSTAMAMMAGGQPMDGAMFTPSAPNFGMTTQGYTM